MLPTKHNVLRIISSVHDHLKNKCNTKYYDWYYIYKICHLLFLFETLTMPGGNTVRGATR